MGITYHTDWLHQLHKKFWPAVSWKKADTQKYYDIDKHSHYKGENTVDYLWWVKNQHQCTGGHSWLLTALCATPTETMMASCWMVKGETAKASPKKKQIHHLL